MGIPCFQPRQPYYQFQIKMDPVLSPVIHEILPTEILGMIFKEHAKLEWLAPITDGRVCRLWRRTVLNTPRAWAYLRVPKNHAPSKRELRLRLHRSSTAPLHAAGEELCRKLYDLLSDHHTRIASLQMQYGGRSFFQGRDFPCMQLLDVQHWCSDRWGSMPKLQSLRLSDQTSHMVSLSELAPLEMLVLSSMNCTSVLRHSQSLTTLMLCNVYLADEIFGPVISLPSLVEYGMHHPTASRSYPAAWHLSFPNIQRLAIRADDPVLLSIFTSLANQPHLLPALHTISAGGARPHTHQMAGGVQEKIASLVQVRNEACNGNIALFIETVVPTKIPIFFGAVSDLSVKWFCVLLTHILETRACLLKTQTPGSHLFTFICRTMRDR